MSDIQAMLKARQLAVAASKENGAIPGSSSPEKVAALEASAAKALSTIATGLQSSVESSGFPVLDTTHASGSKAIFSEELAEKAIAVYKATGLRKYHRPKGIEVKPVHGFFYAMDEVDVAMLKDFEAMGKVVAFAEKEPEA